MKFTSKDYKIFKPKKLIKTNNLLFIVTGCNIDLTNWIKTKQTLTHLDFVCYKVLNGVALKLLNNSVYCELKPVMYGVTLFIKSQMVQQNMLEKKNVLKQFESLSFDIKAIKFNNKIYSINHYKKIYSFHYYNTKLIFYKFAIVNIKSYYKI